MFNLFLIDFKLGNIDDTNWGEVLKKYFLFSLYVNTSYKKSYM